MKVSLKLVIHYFLGKKTLESWKTQPFYGCKVSIDNLEKQA